MTSKAPCEELQLLEVCETQVRKKLKDIETGNTCLRFVAELQEGRGLGPGIIAWRTIFNRNRETF